jgi:mRNA interferase MazF
VVNYGGRILEFPLEVKPVSGILFLSCDLQMLRGNVLVHDKESKLGEDSVILVAQLYALDRQKFIERISKVKRETMEKVENGMLLVLGINK